MYELEDICSEEQKEEFRISDDKTADWALKIIQKERQEVERLCKTIDEEIEMLKLKKQRIADSLDNKIGFLQGKLFEYFRTVESKELKTCYKYKLPSGELVYNKEAVKYERDDEKILKYLLNNNKFEYIDVVHKVKWSELKKNEDIEHIEGITKIKTPMQFIVK